MTAHPARAWLAIAAATAPSLLAYNVSPSPTFLNQALAVALWGAFVLVAPGAAGRPRGAGTLLAALALLGASVLWSWGPGALPAGLALSALAMLLAAALLVAAGAAAQGTPDATRLFGDVCLGLVVAGLCNVAIAVVQVFAPALTDGSWIATSGLPGRAVGNLRQPNHLSSLLMWSAIAVVALAELGRLRRPWAAGLFGAMLFAVVLSGSRTGLLSVLLLALWGLADRRLSRPARALLLAAPLVCAISWLGMSEWARLSQATFGAAARLSEGDVSSSRFAIWRDTLALIRMHPWAGVGFGEFNFAWSLTPFPARPVAFFDHTHNLPLHLAVELGLPLAALLLALLLGGLWLGARRALAAPGHDGLARRCAMLVVLMVGVHSLLEYPLWYSYFLLPTAWAWGFALGTGRPGGAAVVVTAPAPSAALAAGGAALVVGAALSVLDYRPVAEIFGASPGAPPLAQRIARGQRSVFFSHHADYAAATTELDASNGRGADALQPFTRATHYLLDTRLMMAWARALAAQGRLDEARAIAARLREFRNPNADDFFAACQAAPASASPFQCTPPAREPGWRAYLQR